MYSASNSRSSNASESSFFRLGMDRRYTAEGIFDFASTRSNRSFAICADSSETSETSPGFVFVVDGLPTDGSGGFSRLIGVSATTAVSVSVFAAASSALRLGAFSEDAFSSSFAVSASRASASNSLSPLFARLVAAEAAASSRGARSRNRSSSSASTGVSPASRRRATRANFTSRSSCVSVDEPVESWSSRSSHFASRRNRGVCASRAFGSCVSPILASTSATPRSGLRHPAFVTSAS